MNSHYNDLHVHRKKCIYQFRHAYLPDRQIDKCVSIKQTDSYAFIFMRLHVHIYEYSLGRASHTFNKLAERPSEKPEQIFKAPSLTLSKDRPPCQLS